MIKVLIADDQELFCDLLGFMLQNNPEINVAGRAYNGSEAMKLAFDLDPDVILLDLSMPILNGFDVITKIKEAGLKTKILMLTASNENADVLQALERGADGYILKSVNKDKLIQAIKSVYAGLEIIDKDISISINRTRFSNNRYKGKSRIIVVNDIHVELNERDLKIIKMIVDGLSVEEMAQNIFVAEGRLRNIITELIDKLMVKDKTQLAIFALKNKLI
jgi:DNA-binding NarL/FixJ family response regulator